ncbi:MAG TPA: LysR substrate-binding domain-containing protein [Burkholderiaceae bacterium]|nr:LysR substrate-binding domain-containing protein [Burkholderiaceae bacterium]
MKNATLRQLKVFETAARHLSFSRAAQELHLTQPAVSTQIKLLQQHAGCRLFEQLGKKVYLTPAGSELLRYSRAIIELFRQAGEAMAKRQGASGGTLNVAVISAGDYFFPQLLAEFARNAPAVKLNLGVFNRQQLLQQLADNLTDLAVMVRPPRELDTVNEPFASHPYVIVARPDHPLARRRRVPVSALLGEPWLTRERGSDTWNSMEDAFGAQLAKLNVAMEIRSTETIKQAVIAGLGLSFLSAHTIGRELEMKQLAVLDVAGFPLQRQWYVVHLRQKVLAPVAMAFKAFLLERGAQLIEQVTSARAAVARRR